MTVTPVLVPSYANPKGWSIYYSSSDESIASINQQGVIRAISAGTAILSVTGSSEGKNPIIKTIFLTVFPDAIPYTNVAVYNFANSQITVDTAGVKSCAVVTDTLEDIIDEDNDERLAVSSDHVHYYNNPSHPNLGLICGLTSIEGKLRLNLIKSVHKVVLYAAGRTATDSFVINDSEKQTPGYSFQDENAIQRLVFFLEEGSKEINITSLNYGFISAIEFYSI